MCLKSVSDTANRRVTPRVTTTGRPVTSCVSNNDHRVSNGSQTPSWSCCLSPFESFPTFYFHEAHPPTRPAPGSPCLPRDLAWSFFPLNGSPLCQGLPLSTASAPPGRAPDSQQKGCVQMRVASEIMTGSSVSPTLPLLWPPGPERGRGDELCRASISINQTVFCSSSFNLLICFVISVQVPWENSSVWVLPGVFDLTSAPPDPLLHLRSSAVWAELSGESVMDGTRRREAFSASCLTEPWSPCDWDFQWWRRKMTTKPLWGDPTGAI